MSHITQESQVHPKANPHIICTIKFCHLTMKLFLYEYRPEKNLKQNVTLRKSHKQYSELLQRNWRIHLKRHVSKMIFVLYQEAENYFVQNLIIQILRSLLSKISSKPCHVRPKVHSTCFGHTVFFLLCRAEWMRILTVWDHISPLLPRFLPVPLLSYIYDSRPKLCRQWRPPTECATAKSVTSERWLV